MISVDQLVDDLDAYPFLGIRLGLELTQVPHDLRVGHAEHAFDLIYSECTPRRIILSVLYIQDVDVFIPLALVWGQLEEFGAVKPQIVRLEVVPKELQEFCQVLR